MEKHFSTSNKQHTNTNGSKTMPNPTKRQYQDAMREHARRIANGSDGIKQLVCDAEGYWLHSPDGSGDWTLTDDAGNPIRHYYTAAMMAVEHYPTHDIRLMS